MLNYNAWFTGAEVAQYTAQHLPDFLKNLQSYKEGKLSQALEETFLGFDETLTKEIVIKELKELAGVEEDEEGQLPNLLTLLQGL